MSSVFEVGLGQFEQNFLPTPLSKFLIVHKSLQFFSKCSGIAILSENNILKGPESLNNAIWCHSWWGTKTFWCLFKNMRSWEQLQLISFDYNCLTSFTWEMPDKLNEHISRKLLFFSKTMCIVNDSKDYTKTDFKKSSSD